MVGKFIRELVVLTTLLKATDKVSLNFIYSDDANKELRDKMNDITYYKQTDGKLVYNIETDVNRSLMLTMTE